MNWGVTLECIIMKVECADLVEEKNPQGFVSIFSSPFSSKGSRREAVNPADADQSYNKYVTLSISSPMMRMAAVEASPLAAAGGLEPWLVVNMVALES